MNIHRYPGANQGKTSMSKGALAKKLLNLNYFYFLIKQQGNINERIMSSICINKTKNISFSSNAKKKLTKEADEWNGT